MRNPDCAVAATVREHGTSLLEGVGLAALNLGNTLVEQLVNGVTVVEEPVFLGVEEVEGTMDDLGGVGVVSAGEFALDALLGLGVEGEGHGGIIAGREVGFGVQMWGRGGLVYAQRRGPLGGRSPGVWALSVPVGLVRKERTRPNRNFHSAVLSVHVSPDQKEH